MINLFIKFGIGANHGKVICAAIDNTFINIYYLFVLSPKNPPKNLIMAFTLNILSATSNNKQGSIEKNL